MKRILVVQTAYLGDVVLTTPLLRELRRRHPGARLTVAVRSGLDTLLAGQSYLDEVQPVAKRRRGRGARGTLQTARRLRAAGPFDLGIAAQRSHRSALILWIAGTGRRVGFSNAAGRWSYHRRVPWESGDHATRRYLALAGPPQQGTAADPSPRIEIPAPAAARALELLAGAGIEPARRLAFIAPGSVWATKRWPAAHYAELAGKLAQRGLLPVTVGSPGERDVCAAVVRQAPTPVVDLSGRTDLAELAALLARGRLAVTNDSGPGHLAAAVGCPVVAIFGPTHRSFGYAPTGTAVRIAELAGLACRPCHPHGPRVCPLGHFRCMRELPAGQVMAAADELLAGRPQPVVGATREG